MYYGLYRHRRGVALVQANYLSTKKNQPNKRRFISMPRRNFMPIIQPVTQAKIIISRRIFAASLWFRNESEKKTFFDAMRWFFSASTRKMVIWKQKPFPAPPKSNRNEMLFLNFLPSWNQSGMRLNRLFLFPIINYPLRSCCEMRSYVTAINVRLPFL